MIKVENRKIYLFFIYPLATLVFVIISVLFILSAKGYTVNLKRNGIEIEKTGMLIVSTKPGGTEIFLNGKRTSKKTNGFFSVKIDNLGKKSYLLTLKKDGYSAWEKEVSVFPEMVTWANYVLLFKTEPRIEKTNLDGALVQSLSSYENKFIALLAKNSKGENINIINSSSGDVKTVLETEKMPVEQKISNIKISDWSKDQRHMLFSGTLKGESKQFVLSTDSKKVEELSSFSPIKFDRLIFNTANSDELYGSAKGEITRINIRSRDVSPSLEKQVVYYNFGTDGRVYYIKANSGNRTFIEANGDFSGKTVISEVPLSDSYEIKISEKNQEVALEVNKSVLYLLAKVGDKNSLITFGKKVSDFSWSPDGEKLSYKDGDTVFIYENDDYKKESKEYKFPDSAQFKNTVWYDDSHLLTEAGGNILIMDFDGTNRVSLGSSTGDRGPFFSKDNGDILFFSLLNGKQIGLSRYKVEF